MRTLIAKSGAALKHLQPTKKRSAARPKAAKSKLPAPDPSLVGTQKRGFAIFKRGPNGA